jgi:IS4 transposase
MKCNGAFKRIQNNPHEKNGPIGSDVLIPLTGSKTKKLYPKPLRKIYDAEYHHTYELITNDLEMAVQEIADIYKRRWQVALFFKWTKQNLKIKSFWGTSMKAVYRQIWAALIILKRRYFPDIFFKSGITSHRPVPGIPAALGPPAG